MTKSIFEVKEKKKKIGKKWCVKAKPTNKNLSSREKEKKKMFRLSRKKPLPIEADKKDDVRVTVVKRKIMPFKCERMSYKCLIIL